MQTLENLAKILGPSILPNMQSARAGAECDAALIINAVHDMMRGYKQGTLFSTCIPEVTERMQLDLRRADNVQVKDIAASIDEVSVAGTFPTDPESRGHHGTAWAQDLPALNEVKHASQLQ